MEKTPQAWVLDKGAGAIIGDYAKALWGGAVGVWLQGAIRSVWGAVTASQDWVAVWISVVLGALIAVAAVYATRKSGERRPVPEPTPVLQPETPVLQLTRVEATVLNQMYVHWSAMADMYERMDYDNRGNTSTRFPFNKASWPNFGEPWSFVNARLYAGDQFMSSSKEYAEQIIKAFGWENDLALPRIDENVIMVEFIRETREFQAALDSKINAIRQRGAWPSKS